MSNGNPGISSGKGNPLDKFHGLSTMKKFWNWNFEIEIYKNE